MPEQASPAALALQVPSVQRKLYGQRPSQDGCYQPAWPSIGYFFKLS